MRRGLLVSLALVALGHGAAARASLHARRATVCPAAASALKGVYHPQRLTVLSSCKKAVGTVIFVKQETGSSGDGDLHIRLKLDPGYESLKNARNDVAQQHALVVEYMPRDGGHLPKPSVGEHLVLRGAWVLDTSPNHGWREIHPVWSVIVNGHTYKSGPQNGGSPPNDNSGNSRADCIDHGHPCTGY